MTKRTFEPIFRTKSPCEERFETIKEIFEAVKKCALLGYSAPKKIALPEGVSLRKGKQPFSDTVEFFWWQKYEGGATRADYLTLWSCDYNVQAIYKNLSENLSRYEPSNETLDISYKLAKSLEDTTNKELTIDQYRDQLAANVETLLHYLKQEKEQLDLVNQTDLAVQFNLNI